MDVKWIKLTTTMFDDEKIKIIEAMPDKDAILIIWIKLLTLAGKTNAKGYMLLSQNIPYNDEMLATIFNRPVMTIRLALQTFYSFGMIEYTEDNCICISNWDKHQNVDGMERQKKLRAERNRRYQEKKQLETNENDNKTSSKTKDKTQLDALEEERRKKKEESREKIVDKEIKDKELTPKNTTIPTTENEFKDVALFYENNFGSLSSFIAEQLKAQYDELGAAMTIKAMEIALLNQKTYSYTRGIFNNWRANNIKTISDLDATESKRKRDKEQTNDNQITYDDNPPLKIIKVGEQ